MRFPLDLVASALGLTSSLLPDVLNEPRGVTDETIRVVDEVRQRWGIQGVSIAVVTSPKYKDQGEWRMEYYPLGTADAAGRPVTEDSLFAIASNSKLFTALSVGLMIDNGTKLPNGDKLSWDTKVKDILEDWKLEDKYASDHVDVTDLLSMRSGMPSHDHSYPVEPPAKTIRNMRHLKPSAEIRQKWQYNNGHYIALSHMVPTLTGVPFVDFVQKHLFDKLGMKRTFYNAHTARQAGGMTDGFAHVEVNRTLCLERSKTAKDVAASCIGQTKSIGWWTTTDAEFDAGPGGVISCATDVALWLKELLDPQVIPEYLVAKCATPIMFNGGPAQADRSRVGYGFGQENMNFRGVEVVSHTGGVPGHTSEILRIPSHGIGVAVMTNDAVYGPIVFRTAAYRIFEDLLGMDHRDWEERVAQQLLGSVEVPSKPEHRNKPQHGFDAIVGDYHNAGYGALKLRRLKQNAEGKVLTRHLDLMGLNVHDPVYVAHWDKLWVSHMVFTHHSGPHWNATAVRLYDHQELVVGTADTVPAVVTEHGIGLFGHWASPGPGMQLEPEVHGAAQKAAAWFKRAKRS